MQVEKPHFDVHPSIVYQLGESLITDAVQALIELVKNSYDADATYAKVVIDTEGITEISDAIYPASGGRIVVEDDGSGMRLADIESGWLMISNRWKRDLKEKKKTTPGGRTPLGDKGLGRLGVQRLGENLEIFTKSKGEQGYHLGFSWLDFATAPTLQQVDIHLKEVDYPRAHGTKVVVSNLQEIAMWRGQIAIKRLEQELSQMISPYREIRNFMVTVEVDGKRLELLEISDKVRDVAPVRYEITFDGNTLTVGGMARLDFFRPSTQKGADQFALIVESDNGKAFYDFLQNQKLAKTVGLSRSRSKHWFVDFRWEKELQGVDKVQRNGSHNGDIANPGPFTGEVDSFDLGTVAFQQQSVFDRISEYRRYIKELSGIRVYRDGFAIRVDYDWLELGAQWTSAPSYYGLKPDNTLGYIALSARDNINLEETTDREGFKDTPYYRNFYALLLEFKRFTTMAHEFFGRSWAEFRNKRNEELARVDSRKTVEDISRTIKKGLADAATHRKALGHFKVRLETGIKESRSVVAKLAVAKEVTLQLREKVTEAMSAVEPLLEEARTVIVKLEGYLDEIQALRDMGQVLEDRIEGLRRQMDDIYETVALGLTAEALSHEIFNVADQLAKRTKSAQMGLRTKGVTDRTILTFIEYVHSAVMALRKQMSFLSPALRYVREQRDDIDVAGFLKDMAEFYSDRLTKNNISINIRSATDKSLTIRINKGKLTQIINNFVLNSEYWLKEDIAQNRLTRGMIVFEVSHPFLRIFDDGRGIDPTVEHALFEPFISTKAKGQGRGLGLFIVKQLLDSEGCSVGVLPERNKHRRLYKFQIDFRGAINE
jgi:signal transduction histidine kinase